MSESSRPRTGWMWNFTIGTSGQAAAEAKNQEEATLQAHLGWSGGGTRKKLRLQIEVTTEARTHYQEIEIGTGESIGLRMTLTDSAPRMYKDGKPVNANEARELIQEAEESLLAEGPPLEAKPHTLADESTRTLLSKWMKGQLSSEEITRSHGRSMVIFLEECRQAQTIGTEMANHPDTGVGQALRTHILGESWKRWLQSPEVSRDYQKWREGALSDEVVRLRYGDSTVRAYWYLLRANRARVPTVAECGSEAEDEEEPPTAEVRHPEAHLPPADTAIDAATLCYPSQQDPAQQDTILAAFPPNDIATSQQELFQQWLRGEVEDQQIISSQGSGVWHHFLTRREHLREQKRREDREHQEWLSREFSSDSG